MPSAVTRMTFNYGQADTASVTPNTEAAYNHVERMSNLVRVGGEFQLRPGVEDVSVDGEKIGEGVVSLADEGFFYQRAVGVIDYIDIRGDKTYPGVRVESKIHDLRSIRLRNFIFLYGKTKDFKVIDVRIGEVRDFIHDPNNGISPPFSQYDNETVGGGAKVLNTKVIGSTGRRFRISFPRGVMSVGDIGALIKADLRSILFKVVEETVDDVVIRTGVEGQDTDTLTVVFVGDPGKSDDKTGFAGLGDITGMRRFGVPNALTEVSGRLVSVMDETVCFSEVQSPLNFQAVQAVNGSVVSYPVPTSAYSVLVGGSFRETVIDMRAVNRSLFLFGKSHVRIIVSDSGFVAGTLVSLTSEIGGRFVGVMDARALVVSSLGNVSAVLWENVKSAIDIVRLFPAYFDKGFASGIVKAVEVFDGSNLMVVLGDGGCVLMTVIGRSTFGFYPQDFGGKVLDVMSFRNECYLAIDNGKEGDEREVFIKKWHVGSKKQWDKVPGDIKGKVAFYPWQGNLTQQPLANATAVPIGSKTSGLKYGGSVWDARINAALRMGRTTLVGEPNVLTITSYDVKISGVFFTFTWNNT